MRLHSEIKNGLHLGEVSLKSLFLTAYYSAYFKVIFVEYDVDFTGYADDNTIYSAGVKILLHSSRTVIKTLLIVFGQPNER